MNRKEFLRLAIGLGATIGTFGCSGGDDDDDGADAGTAGSTGGGNDATDTNLTDTNMTGADDGVTTGGPATDGPGSTGVDGSTSLSEGSSTDDGETTNTTNGSTDEGSSSEGGSTTAAVDCTNNPTVMIGGNHMHTLVVPAADVAAALPVDYDIQGGSAHTHTVSVSTEDFETLADTGTVMVTSTNNAGHTHSVTLSCA